jgi:hypothetical protein
MDAKWVSVVVALVVAGIGVRMKVSDGSLKDKWWGRLGTVLILSGGTVFMFLVLGMFGIQFQTPIVFGDKQDQRVSAQWSSQLLMPVHNKVFRAETVKLDGYAYVNCEFDDVTFEYEGTAPTSIVNPTIKRPSGGGRVINFRSGNPAVRQTMRLISMLNKLVEEGGAVNMSLDSSQSVK